MMYVVSVQSPDTVSINSSISTVPQLSIADASSNTSRVVAAFRRVTCVCRNAQHGSRGVLNRDGLGRHAAVAAIVHRREGAGDAVDKLHCPVTRPSFQTVVPQRSPLHRSCPLSKFWLTPRRRPWASRLLHSTASVVRRNHELWRCCVLDRDGLSSRCGVVAIVDGCDWLHRVRTIW